MDSSLRSLYPWFTALGAVVGGLVIAAFYKDQFREWKVWQREYVKNELARAASPAKRPKRPGFPSRSASSSCPNWIGWTAAQAAISPWRIPAMPASPRHWPTIQITTGTRSTSLAARSATKGRDAPRRGRPPTAMSSIGIGQWWTMNYIESACGKCHLPTDVPDAPKLVRATGL